ncbi:glutamate racemase [bacterium]|nr:glutamate racemase [bacterium]
MALSGQTGRAAPIGIFDSGVGGLTVVKEIQRQLPDENMVYLGDTARTPYGSKARETIIRFTLEGVEKLLKYRIKALVIACNTASALVLPALRKRILLPVIGVIQPGARAALHENPHGAIGVIGTSATIQSQAYARTLSRLKKNCRVFSAACPLLAPLVEEGWLTGPITISIINAYLDPLLKKNIKRLILGCTHYPALKPALSRVCGKEIRIIDSAEEVARELKNTLEQKNLRKPASSPGRHKFLVTDVPAPFLRVGTYIMGRRLDNVQRVNL